MRSIVEFLGTKIIPSKIKATDENLFDIVEDELKRLGKRADLNHIDVSNCTKFSSNGNGLDGDGLFENTGFCGDVSKWDMRKALDTKAMFFNCKSFNCDLSEWNLDSIENAMFMFSCCESLETVPHLPKDTLTVDCYKEMFSGCISLKEAPELPAMKLAHSCYLCMFADCINLVKAPDLPAINLVDKCYVNMFCGCESLKQIPKIAGKDWRISIYSYGMFNDTNLNK